MRQRSSLLPESSVWDDFLQLCRRRRERYYGDSCVSPLHPGTREGSLHSDACCLSSGDPLVRSWGRRRSDAALVCRPLPALFPFRLFKVARLILEFGEGGTGNVASPPGRERRVDTDVGRGQRSGEGAAGRGGGHLTGRGEQRKGNMDAYRPSDGRD